MNSVTDPAARPRRRDRLLRPFISRSRGRSPSPQSLTSPPSSTLPASTLTTLSNHSIVDRAWKQLSDHERSILQPFLVSSGGASDALEHCLTATIEQRQVWEGKRWTITFGRICNTTDSQYHNGLHCRNRKPHFPRLPSTPCLKVRLLI